MSSIRRPNRIGKIFPNYEVAPNVGANGFLMDTSFSIRLPGGALRVASAVTLLDGRSVEIGSANGSSVTLTGTITKSDGNP